MPKQIYISGPMTGLPDFNYPAFMEAAETLRAQGHLVYNPAEYAYTGDLETFPIREAFADYCRYICLQADALYMLPGWKMSAGARAEYALAVRLGLEIIDG